MPKGVSERYTLERRSAAAKKGAAARKRQAAMRAASTPQPGELKTIVDRAIASVQRAREAASGEVGR